MNENPKSAHNPTTAAKAECISLPEKLLFVFFLMGAFAIAMALAGCSSKNGATQSDATVSSPAAVATPEAEQITPSPTPSPTPTPKIELTNEEIVKLLGIEQPDDLVDLATISLVVFTIVDENGNEVPKIELVRTYSNGKKDSNGNEIDFIQSLWSDKDLFFVSEIGTFISDYLVNGEPMITNTRLQSLSAEILDFTGVPNIEYVEADLGYMLSTDTKEYHAFFDVFFNATPESNTQLTRLEVAKLYLDLIGYDLCARAEYYDESLDMPVPKDEVIAPTSAPAITPLPSAEETEIARLFGIDRTNSLIDFSGINLVYYTILDENGKRVPKLDWVQTSFNYADDGGEVPIHSVESVWSNKTLFTFFESSDLNDHTFTNITPTIVNEEFRALSPEIILITDILNTQPLAKELGFFAFPETEEYKTFESKVSNSTVENETRINKLDAAMILYALVGPDLCGRASYYGGDQAGTSFSLPATSTAAPAGSISTQKTADTEILSLFDIDRTNFYIGLWDIWTLHYTILDQAGNRVHKIDWVRHGYTSMSPDGTGGRVDFVESLWSGKTLFTFTGSAGGDSFSFENCSIDFVNEKFQSFSPEIVSLSRIFDTTSLALEFGYIASSDTQSTDAYKAFRPNSLYEAVNSGVQLTKLELAKGLLASVGADLCGKAEYYE